MVVVSPSSLQKILTSYYSTKNTLTMAKKVKTFLAAACALAHPPNFHLSTALYLSPYAKLYMQEQCVKTCTE